MAYEFKVGDKGKTRGGDDYEVVYVDRTLTEYHQVYAKVAGYQTLLRYNITGTHNTSEDSLFNLMPPSRTVYVNVYEPDTFESFAYNTEEEARASAADYALAVAVPVTIPAK